MANVVHALNVDVEAVNVAVLAVALPAARVATQVPRTKAGVAEFPDNLVVVRRVGGPAMSVAHDRPLMLVECWHSDKTRAADLAGRARAVLLDLDMHQVQVPALDTGDTPEFVYVSHYSEAGGPVDYPDPRTQKSRYQFTHEQVVRRSSRSS